jgi:hypothetical protein
MMTERRSKRVRRRWMWTWSKRKIHSRAWKSLS